MRATAGLPRVGGGGRGWLLVALVGNGLGQATAAVVTALVVERAFSRYLVAGVPRPDARAVLVVAATLGAAALGSAWLRSRERVDAERLGQHYTHELRLRLFAHLTATSSRRLQQHSQGATVLRFIGDLTALRKWISLGLARLIVATMMTGGSLLALLVLSPTLGLVVLGVLVLGTTWSLVVGRGLRGAAREARRRRSRLAANVNEKVGAVAVVQAFGQAEQEQDRVRRQSRRLQRAMVEQARFAGRLRGISEGTAGGATAAVIIVGVTGGAPPASVAATMTIVGLLAAPLRDLGRVQEYWHGAQVSREKLRAFLARPTGLVEVQGAPGLEAGAGRLELDDVTVDGVLHGVTATAESGQVVAVVGPNGAGKTTLLSVAARLLDPDAGSVLLDGQDLAAHPAADARRRLGLVGPDLPLLRGTIERNLCYRWPDAPRHEVERVMTLCGLDEVVATLPDGVDTRIAEGGAGLSAGQRQRLSLGRALLGNPSVLLLDEADANLDRAAATVVDDVLTAHPGTTLVVTHRRERLATADVVWCLEDGRLVEVGPPDELLAGDGPTARLFGPAMEAAR